ncbi:MAG: hypothetical protein HeimC2_08520 [Candidatus Heimdallarchaeota archaeon LC_2]|nr:MAG: hypothetical protein HeimC2_08520 [Candidatus Heimdallarchaeota archaeon LC_2]
MSVDEKSEGEGLLSIQAIIIMSKAGIPVFEDRLDSFSFDNSFDFEPTLVAGVSSALSMYMDEFSSDGKYGYETLKKSGLTMSSFKTNLSSFIIVSDDDLPEILIGQIQKSQKRLDDIYRVKFDGTDRSREFLNPDIVYQTFDESDFKLGIKKKLLLDIDRITNVRYERSIGPNLRFNLGSLKEIFDQLPIGQNLVTLNQIVSHFESKKLEDKLISNLIILAYKHKLIQYQQNKQ